MASKARRRTNAPPQASPAPTSLTVDVHVPFVRKALDSSKSHSSSDKDKTATPAAAPRVATASELECAQKRLDQLRILRPRLYTAARMANDTIVGELRSEWVGLLRGTPLAGDAYPQAYDVYDALRKKGDPAALAVAAKLKALADRFEYTREAAKAAACARAGTMLTGTVGCPDFAYASLEDAVAEAAIVCAAQPWVQRDVTKWFPSHRLARAYSVEKLDALRRTLGLVTC